MQVAPVTAPAAGGQDDPVVRLTPYGIAVKALREIRDGHEPGTPAHGTARTALDEAGRRTAENVAARIFAPEPQPAPRGYDPGARTLALTVWQQEAEAADAIAARSGTTREVVLRVILKEGLARYGEAALTPGQAPVTVARLALELGEMPPEAIVYVGKGIGPARAVELVRTPQADYVKVTP